MKITLISEKHGVNTLLIDDEDWPLIKDFNLWAWTTPRHYGYYVLYQHEGISKRLHRLIMSAAPGQVVDHINGNPLDNRKCNLRVTSQAKNNMNARKRKSAQTSKYKGVHLDRTCNKWKAQIQVNKQKKSLGTFKTEVEAAKAYNKAALEFFGSFAVLNNLEDT